MSKLSKNGDGRIVNPFAQTVLTLSVDDQFNANLQAPGLHPAMVAKLLMNTMIDVIFSYVETTKVKPEDEETKSQIIT